MKFTILIFSLFSFMSLSACPDLDNVYDKYSNRNMITIDQWTEIEMAISNCRDNNYSEKINDLKKIRIETLNKFKRMNINEEGGARVSDLLSKLTNTPFEIKPKFENSKGNKPGSPAQPSTICKYVKLENEVINESTVKDQGSLPWCYAVLASEMAGYKLKIPLSYISFYSGKSAISDELRVPELKGADTKETMEAAYKRLGGFCAESSLPSTKLDLKQFADLGEMLLFLTNPESKNIYCYKNDIKKVFPNIDTNLLYSSVAITQKLYIEKLIANHCQKSLIKKPEIKLRCLTPENSSNFLAQIDEQLYEKKQPVGYAFRASDMLNESRKADHGAMIVGKIYNEKTNKCDYIIRNSWGRSCSFERVGKSEYCMKDNNGYTGYLQFPSDVLEKYLLAIYKYAN